MASWVVFPSPHMRAGEIYTDTGPAGPRPGTGGRRFFVGVSWVGSPLRPRRGGRRALLPENIQRRFAAPDPGRTPAGPWSVKITPALNTCPRIHQGRVGQWAGLGATRGHRPCSDGGRAQRSRNLYLKKSASEIVDYWVRNGGLPLRNPRAQVGIEASHLRPWVSGREMAVLIPKS